MSKFKPSKHTKPGRNFGYPVPVEGKMSQNYLWQMEQDARSLYSKLRPNDTLPGWVNNYIATSADRLQQASRYMEHEMTSQGYGCGCDAMSNPQEEEVAWVGPFQSKLGTAALLLGAAAGTYLGHKKTPDIRGAALGLGYGAVLGLIVGKGYEKYVWDPEE